MRTNDLAADVVRTFRLHRAYSILNGANNGVMATAPLIGIKALDAPDWLLAAPLMLSGLGLLSTLAAGLWMARRSKTPFVLVPGFASAAACLAMAATPKAAPFLVLLGAFNFLEIVTRPAMTAVIRANYPVEFRGRLTGALRRSSAATFLTVSLATAWALDHDGSWEAVNRVLAAAGCLQALAFLAFAAIRSRPDVDDDLRTESGPWLREALATMARDRRFLRYLSGCLLFGVGGMMYLPYVMAYLSKDLGLGYVGCVLLGDVVPSLISIATLGRVGAWLDRVNPLVAWAWIRLSWGLDPILLAFAVACPPAATAIAATGRGLRGLAMNGSWLLYWQLGTNYFTNRRDLTPAYMGLNTTMTGVLRLLGPSLGAVMTAATSRRGALWLGGAIVIASGWHAWRQAEAERAEGRPATFTDRERVETGAT